MTQANSNQFISLIIKWIEKILAVAVVLAVMIYIGLSASGFMAANWHEKEIFYELIYRVLLVTIGLELARMLVTHSFIAILELLAFVVARKMLKPDITSVDVVLGVVSFVALLAANYYFVTPLLKPDPQK
ncbi:MAG: hypothetical protein WC352_00750 [Candidatus Omnitrophota bacterium]